MPGNIGTATGAVIAASLSIEAAAGILLVADAAPSEPLTFIQMLGVCVLGSIGGTVASFAVFTPNDKEPTLTARRYFTKISASFFSGVCLAPMAVDYMGWDGKPFFAMGTSFVMSLMLISFMHAVLPPIIHALAPILSGWAEKFVKSKLPKLDEDDDNEK